jgi:hypothetical protein
MNHTFKDAGDNTPSIKRDEKCVTTKPSKHDLNDQAARIREDQRGPNARINDELRDGSQTALDPNDADLAPSAIGNSVSRARPLLCIEGLLNIVKMMKGSRRIT